MDKVYIMDSRGSEKVATKVRYFKYDNTNYFVYTLDEVDEEGYVKLYIKKIVGTEDVGIDDSEWPHVKEIVQEVFREIKAGTHYNFEDLSLSQINEIMDIGTRIFKLKKSVVNDILNKNKDINDVDIKLIESLKAEEDTENMEDVLSKNEKTIDPDLGASLLNLLKRVEEVSKEEIFNQPEQKEKVEIEEIKENKEVKNQNSVLKENIKDKYKPLVIGSVPTKEYKEKIVALETEIKTYQEQIFNLKKDLEQIKNENSKLKKQNDSNELTISRYEERINYLKNIIKDI